MDYSLLRPIDVEAAMAGEPIVFKASGVLRQYVAGPDKSNRVRVIDEYGLIQVALWQEDSIRMAPLAWVEGKPVYKGDVLYVLGKPREVIGTSRSAEGWLLAKDAQLMHFNPDAASWNPPKVKREVKLLAHLGETSLFWLRDGITATRGAIRIPSEDKTIEVEE